MQSDFTQSQLDQLQEYLDKGMSPTAIADSIARINDLSRVETLRIEQAGRELQLAAEMRPARYRNALTGLAAGDAWGYQVEFTSYSAMGPGFVAPPRGTWVISDDTQMTLAVAQALGDVDDYSDIGKTTDAIVDRFQKWRVDPDNNRAPGNACMGSLRNLSRGAQWHEKDGAQTSAGCGAVMRLTPTAFAPDAHWLGLTALQAVVTHNHPMAVAAALLLADATRHAYRRGGQFLTIALETADAILDGSHDWLRDDYLAQVLAPATADLRGYLTAGLGELLHDALRAAKAKQRSVDRTAPADFGDPCDGIGEGWESATAVALALLVADAATGPRPLMTGFEALGWASTSTGDSDSIACMAGAVIGASRIERGYWADVGVAPIFEERYAAEISAAAAKMP